MLKLLIPFEIFFKPALILLLLWSVYRTVFKKDKPAGLALYLALVIIVDGFLNTGIFIPGFESGSIKYSEVCALFLVFNKSSIRPDGKNDRLILLLVLSYFLLLFYASIRGYTLAFGMFTFRRIVIPQIIAFLVAYRGFKDIEDYKHFLLYLIPILLIIGLFTFWDVFFDRVTLLKSDMLGKPEYWNNKRAGRYGSFFLNPNFMGAFAVLVFPGIFVRTFFEKNNRKRIFCLSGLLALTFALIETQSRGPFLAFVVSGFFFTVIPLKRFPIVKKIGFITLFLFMVGLFMPGFFKHMTERFDTLKAEESEKTVSRESVWEYTEKIISDYPFFGIGIGEIQFKDYMLKYGFEDEYNRMPLDNPHNSYLQIAVHAGIPALVIFITLNFLLIKKGIAFILKNKQEENTLYLAGFLSGIVGFLSCIYVDMHMFTQNVAPVYWLLFGLAYSLINTRAVNNTQGT